LTDKVDFLQAERFVAERKRKGGWPRRELQPGERVPMSFRVTPEFKDRLDCAKAGSGRSLAQEIELRLDQSLRDEHQAELFSELHYGRELAGLLVVIGRALKDSGTHAAAQATGRIEAADNWLSNRSAFDEAKRAVDRLFEKLRPPEEQTAPLPITRHLGERVADSLLRAIGNQTSSFMEVWAAPVRARLGAVAARVRGYDSDVPYESAITPGGGRLGTSLTYSDNPGDCSDEPRMSVKDD
jgi:hypothetical protein